MERCNACQGTYQTTLPDGTRYFHRCPPLSLPELTAAVAAGKVVLPGAETPVQAIAKRIYERANARDENLASTSADAPATIKAAGDGTAKIADPPPDVVKVPK